jgi:ABC-type transport system involved in multi-copper enzyme maturation permease subunit
MNLREAAARAQTGLREQPWRLWARQLGILVQREVRRSLFSRRRLWVYLLTFFPVLVMAVNHRIVHTSHPVDATTLQNETQVFAAIFQFYYIRLALFFACMGIFTWLFRGEMVERTLHYPFLSPVRREVLVVGKFLAGAAIVIALFEVAVAGCFYFLYSRFGSLGWAYVFDGPGLGQLGSYLLIIALGALGYGAVFLALSLVFRNPIVPGALFLGWETVIPVLPGWLQMLSVTFYLKHLSPVSVPVSGLAALFTVVTEPVSAMASVAGLLCFTAVVLVFACYRIRRVEITYTSD